MSSDYRDMRDAAVLVGHALEARGWTLYGYKKDRSDMQVDYFDPASWDGIAVKEDRIACVYVSDYEVKSRSGKDETRKIPVPGETCSRCQGSKVDPLGWTLEEAREKPALYHTDELRGRYLGSTERTDTPNQHLTLADGSTVSWLHLAVSPIPFDAPGRRLHCLRCQGRGHDMAEPRTEVLFKWPRFQANPKGKTWHVEAAGQIIASGTGLKSCSPYFNINRAAALEAAESLADRIDRATAPNSELAPSSGLSDAPALTVNVERGGLELRFPDKPSEEIRTRMKAAGWRWTRFGGCWYHRNTESNRAFAEALIAQLSSKDQEVTA